MANELHSTEEIGSIYTLSYRRGSMNDGIASLRKLVQQIITDYQTHQLQMPPIDLVGHSQGAMIACEYSYVREPDVAVNQVVSIAGRLRPLGWPTWFYRHLIPNIEAIEQAPKDTLATIAASHDWLVPIEAVHVATNPRRQTTVMGTGHVSVVYHKETWGTLSKLLITND
jgi:predicted esterase